ncbi:MAG: TetR/AcrR family transcriptional regulator [Dysgonamonadaceae bacterium]|jgi:AcrR family transcriptional regulator|nr:TetR/AcrR family transcriptional regulator [Dysgonamonadaceae bacterium]MDD3308841.1 TetR/AcrR family transcriptional regulator [Dysgonamonadaceae bacterium]MDD3900575.1 TetR/AcrR family transcriptional regulator [Dysgonamonadaceae bacterium]MDD4398984.1 TetR/AcrR family transcriptional regulator [Dysgonamonadaceae bacterium]MEA5080481.1 TetR/AcrR family transcriptional regulator [Dysgonamonadaceae bacterium]
MEVLTTEQKIINAANKIFSLKGFAATKTREIAEEAGINLALLNYYFGSKENLFKIVVKEKFKMLIEVMAPILSDTTIPLRDKVESITNNYTQLLLENEELPIFVLNEWSVNKEMFAEITLNARKIAQPVIENQLKESGLELSVADFITNILGLIMFPFVAKQLIISSGLIKEEEFITFVTERKDKIIAWILK